MTFKFQPGDRVTHPDWPAGSYAVVANCTLQQVRAHNDKRGRPLKPRPEHCEAVVMLDRAMPIAGSTEEDLHWMECGLSLLEPGAGDTNASTNREQSHRTSA